MTGQHAARSTRGPGDTRGDVPAADGARLRERALQAAATAYAAAHGHPLEHPVSGRVRWRTSTLGLVAAALVLAVLVAVVGVRAVTGIGPAGQAAPTTVPLPVAEAGPAGAPDVPAAPDVPGAPPTDDATAPDIVLHVVGAVAAPGVVRLPAGSRVADAVEAAGGPAPEADLGALNLARVVQDGEQVRVPRPGDDPEPPDAGPGGGTGAGVPGGPDVGVPAGRVDLNTATDQALVALPGIGPVLARRVVEHRETHGPFASVEDLTAVSGIGDRVLDGLRDHVVVP